MKNYLIDKFFINLKFTSVLSATLSATLPMIFFKKDLFMLYPGINFIQHPEIPEVSTSQQKLMQLLDFITIAVFAAGVVIMGLSFSGKSRNMKSFFAAGGAVPWPMSGLSLFMGFFSAGTFVVWGSIAYTSGWVSVSIQWTMALAGLAVGAFIAPRWHKTGALTAAEYITHRLGTCTQKVYTYLFLFVSLFTTAAFLYPVAKIVEVSTGLPLNACILLLGCFCILYVTVGGLWAVMSTDVLQFVILTTAVLIVVPLSFERIEGVTEFFRSAPDGFFRLTDGDYSLGFIIAFGIYNAIFLSGNWAYVQRYTSVASRRSSRNVGLLFGGLYVISAVLWMLPPMIYRLIDPSLDSIGAEGAYLLMCREVLPAGLLGLMLGGMVFATASSLNATLNISSGVVTNDIFRRLCPASSDKTLIRVARISTVLFGLIAIGVALLIPKMGGIVNVVISVAALTGVPLYLPIIWSLFSRRQTGVSVVTTTLLSLTINALFKFVMPSAGLTLDRAEEMILGVTFPVVILFVFECYYKLRKTEAASYAGYAVWEQKNETKRNAETLTQTSDKDNAFSRKVIGTGIILTGVVITLLGLIAPTERALVVGMGLLLMLIGVKIRRYNSNNENIR